MKIRTLFVLLVFVLLLSSCGTFRVDLGGTTATPELTAAPQLTQAEIDATVEARVAQQLATSSGAPTSAPVPTAAAPDTTVPAAPTAAPFAPTAVTERGAPTVPAASTSTAAPPAANNTAAEVTTFKPVADAMQQIVNIELVFDASGSMAQQIPGANETRIEAARRAIEQVIDTLPTIGTLNVGFRVYGHKGDNTEAGKAVSCQSTELLVPVQGVNKDVLRQQATAFEPTGWTPISLALQKASEDLPAGENVKNVIIMVTDGEETCAGDPCTVAKALRESGAQVRIDVVGFGQDPTLKDKLACVPANSGGTFTDAQNGDALGQTLEELITASIKRSYLQLMALGPNGKVVDKDHAWNGVVTIKSIVDVQSRPIDIDPELLANESRRTPLESTGQQRFELAPGTYRFTLVQRLDFGPFAIDRPDNGYPPLANLEQTYTAEIVEGQTTNAVVGVGSLTMDDVTGQLAGSRQEACDLQIEVQLNGQWQEYYAVADTDCSNGQGQISNVRFGTEYPLLPGRYRIVNAKRNMVIADNIDIVPGKAVKVRVTDGS